MEKTINDILLEHIIETTNIPIIVDFWASWCAPCKILNNIIKEIKIIFKNKIKLIKINIDFNPYSIEKFSVKNVPTLLIIKNKNILVRKIGYISKEYIKINLKNILNEK